MSEVQAGVGYPISAVAHIEKQEQLFRRKVWLFFIFLAALLHFIFFCMHLSWFAGERMPQPMEVGTMSQADLDSLRKKWEKVDQRQKSLLLDTNPSLPSEKEAPPDARYMSDRNIRVEKEQRARDTQVLPRPGQPTQSQTQSKPQEQAKTQSKPSSSHKFAKLGDLGIPFKLNEPAQQLSARNPAQNLQERPIQPQSGGSQYIDERELPTGGENLLNAQQSVYYSFYQRIYEAIGPVWESRLRENAFRKQINPGEYTTSVDVVLDREGRLVIVNKLHTSGVPEFDEAVDYSWKRIPGFLNPPQGLLDSSGQVHIGWTFRVQIGEGSNFQLLPPKRNY